jgi:Helix-turn-helix domain
MRYPASEKLEIIRIVEQSHLPAKRTLDQLGIARRTFYRWYDRYLEGGPEALEDRPSAPSRVWNRIGDDIQDQISHPDCRAASIGPLVRLGLIALAVDLPVRMIVTAQGKETWALFCQRGGMYPEDLTDI